MTDEMAMAKLDLSQMRLLAGDFAKSHYFQDAQAMEQAMVKIQAGAEMGFPPVYSMTKIYIVKGHIAVSAEAMGVMIKRSGQYNYRPGKYTDTEVEIIFTDKGADCFTSRFTLDDAKKADLLKADSGWLKWPRAMLWSKALSQGARIVCPHVIAGAYTPEDFGVVVDGEGTVLGEKIKDNPAEVGAGNVIAPFGKVKDAKPVILKGTPEQEARIDSIFGEEKAKPTVQQASDTATQSSPKSMPDTQKGEAKLPDEEKVKDAAEVDTIIQQLTDVKWNKTATLNSWLASPPLKIPMATLAGKTLREVITLLDHDQRLALCSKLNDLQGLK